MLFIAGNLPYRLSLGLSRIHGFVVIIICIQSRFSAAALITGIKVARSECFILMNNLYYTKSHVELWEILLR